MKFLLGLIAGWSIKWVSEIVLELVAIEHRNQQVAAMSRAYSDAARTLL